MLAYLINEAWKQFHTNFISENSSSQRDLFNATRKLLKQENDVWFPPSKIDCNGRLMRWVTLLSKISMAFTQGWM